MSKAISTDVLDRAHDWKSTASRYAKKVWNFASKNAKRHKLIAFVMFALSFLDPNDIADLISKIEKAVGKDFTKLDDLIRFMMRSESLSGVITDIVNTKVPGDSGVFQFAPELSAGVSEKVRQVLIARQSARSVALDKKAPLSYSSSIDDQRESAEIVKRVRSMFGVRGKQATLELHDALRAFVNTPRGDVEETLSYLEL